jgi:hypothetical protein
MQDSKQKRNGYVCTVFALSVETLYGDLCAAKAFTITEKELTDLSDVAAC